MFADYQYKDNLSQFFNTLSTIGIVIVFLLSIFIHIIPSLPIDHFGHIYFGKSSNLTRIRLAHQKYFNNVGLFVRSSNDYDKYIYLTNIEYIIEQNSKNFIYSINRQENIFCIKQLNQTCFKELNNNHIELYNEQLTNKLINYSIIFQFQKPDFFYFAIFDKNHDGTIDFHEFVLCIAASKPRDLDSHLDYVFEM